MDIADLKTIANWLSEKYKNKDFQAYSDDDFYKEIYNNLSGIYLYLKIKLRASAILFNIGYIEYEIHNLHSNIVEQLLRSNSFYLNTSSIK